MIEIVFTGKQRATALRYLCSKGLLSPSDADCLRVADLIEDTKVTRLEYENAGRMICVVFGKA